MNHCKTRLKKKKKYWTLHAKKQYSSCRSGGRFSAHCKIIYIFYFSFLLKHWCLASRFVHTDKVERYCIRKRSLAMIIKVVFVHLYMKSYTNQYANNHDRHEFSFHTKNSLPIRYNQIHSSVPFRRIHSNRNEKKKKWMLLPTSLLHSNDAPNRLSTFDFTSLPRCIYLYYFILF